MILKKGKFVEVHTNEEKQANAQDKYLEIHVVICRKIKKCVAHKQVSKYKGIKKTHGQKKVTT